MHAVPAAGIDGDDDRVGLHDLLPGILQHSAAGVLCGTKGAATPQGISAASASVQVLLPLEHLARPHHGAHAEQCGLAGPGGGGRQHPQGGHQEAQRALLGADVV